MDILNFINTLGRSTLNEEFEQLFSEGVEDSHIFKAIFLQGPNLSGKDFILDKLLDIKSLTEINTIKTFDYLLGKNKLDFSDPEQNANAKNETELREKFALLGRNAVIINGTADIVEKIVLIKQTLEALGYDTMMIMVNIDDETAKQRNVERGKTGGRVIPEPVRKEKWDLIQNARAQYAQLFQQNYIEFDNSVDLRNADPQTAIQKNQEIQQLLETVQEFLEAEPISDLAKQWIENEQLANQNTPTTQDTQPIQKESINTIDSLFNVLFNDSLSENTIVNNLKPKLYLSDVRLRQQKLIESSSMGLSIKGTDSGLSMSSSGESIARDTGEIVSKFSGKAKSKSGRNSILTKEAIGADGESISNSISEPIEDNKKKKGISISTWKSNKSIAA
jgi:hypothetical protein